MSPALVTVGVPVFNGGALLARALASIRGQDHPALEIVVSDNASTDGTEALCRRLAAEDPRLRYVRQPSNIGPSANFRFVLEHATGKYFMWAAHDDFSSDDYVSRLVAALERNPKAVLAAGRAVFLDVEGARLGIRDGPAPSIEDAPWKAQLTWDASYWIYGLFVRERLLTMIRRYWTYRPWGGDTAWLLGTALSNDVVGDHDAIKYMTLHGNNPLEPRTLREFIPWHLWFGGTLAREILGSTRPFAEKMSAFGVAGRYWLRKTNPHRRAAIQAAMQRFPSLYRLYREMHDRIRGARGS